MKNTIQTLLLLLTLTIGLGGCQKSPINGDLDGQWQIMSLVPEAPEIVLKERLYYCFSLHTCQISEYGTGVWTSGNMTYDEKGKTLYIDFPNAKSELSIARLKQYGIYTNPVTFTIDHLDKKSLVMRDGDIVVTLRKF